jgi:hypothetical protein
MAKSAAQREYDEADRAFRKAWKLLDRIERRLEEGRAVERKRVRQLGDGSGPDAAHRIAQLEVARAEIVGIERLLTELSDLIARHARMTTGQTVQDVAISVAAEIKDEAAEPPVLSTTRRNRRHRPRRRPEEAEGQSAAAAEVGAGLPGADAEAELEPDQAEADAIELAGPTATRRNRHHRPRRRPTAEVAAAEVAAAEVAAADSTTVDDPTTAAEVAAAADSTTVDDPTTAAEVAAAADSTTVEPASAPADVPVAENKPEEAATEGDLGQQHIDPEPATAEPVTSSSFEPALVSAPETDGASGLEPDEALVDALAGAPVRAATRVAEDPIIELPSPVAEPPDMPEPAAGPEALEPFDNVEPSEPSEHFERGGPAGA